MAELAALAAPLIIQRFGAESGIALKQAATAVSMALLATGPSALFAGIVYAMYGSFQYMSEPGIFTLLMSRATPGERGGVSSLNFFVMSAVTRFAIAPF